MERAERPQRAGLVKCLQLADTQLFSGKLRAGETVSTLKISFMFAFKARKT